MAKPRLLDLFCGAGGCSVGYARAGFDVVGVDINPMPHYPFEFHQADALTFPLDGFDVIHASPPCQAYSRLAALTKGEYPQLLDNVRGILLASGKPFIIENVATAPLINPIVLCGSQFGLRVWRHRKFESNMKIAQGVCRHKEYPEPIDVTGTGGFCNSERKKKTGGKSRKPKSLSEAQTAMGIDWMPRKYLSQAIPPAYTEYIGKQLMKFIKLSDLKESEGQDANTDC